MSKMQLYLAGPFFNPKQVATIERIEQMIAANFPHTISMYSPRHDGVLAAMSPEERRRSTKKIFERNCEEIERSDVMLAVIDDRDVGTIWEMGFACGNLCAPWIITYTDQSYGLNVMIQESVEAHVRGIDELRDCLDYLVNGDMNGVRLFRNFHEAVT